MAAWGKDTAKVAVIIISLPIGASRPFEAPHGNGRRGRREIPDHCNYDIAKSKFG